jgi:hypothetical protein
MSTPNHRDNRIHRAIRSYLTNLFILVVLVMLIVASASARPSDSADSDVANAFSIWLDGPIQAIPDGTISYNITSDVTDLYGAQLELSFDPAVLQVLDDNPGEPGIQITPGSCPVPEFFVPNSNSVDNGAGTVSYAVISLFPTAPCDGGVVASIQFQVSPTATVSTTQVQFDVVLLADSNGIEIPVTAVDLDLEIVESHQIFLPVVVKN